VVPLHTIDQWYSLDATFRSTLLQSIKLKDRLQRWLVAYNSHSENKLHEARYRPCPTCSSRGSSPSDYPGWVLEEPRYPGIHPSQASTPCLLRIYNEMSEKQAFRTVEARSQLTFDLGKYIHDMFQSYGRRGAWGPKYNWEVKINAELQQLSADLMLEGSADAENYLLIDDVSPTTAYELKIIHEYKSIKKENFEKLTRPKPEHREQAMIYCKALDAPVVVYLYFNKNDSTMVDYPVQFDHALWAKLETKARVLVDYYNREVVPEGTPGFYCNDCAYAYDCPVGPRARR
jgi:CRISPR/Cas system-associated exonuclease Cas4 (RecB family)